MDSRVEKKKPRKHKPKRKVSELDEGAAQRRRNQTCNAQRAFRQRNKDTIALLNTQVTDLHTTIEKLNACFLTFTDELVASGLLGQDPQVTKSLQRTIEHFITVVQSSHVLKDDNSTAGDDSDSGSVATELPVPKRTQHAAPLSVNESTSTISGPGMDSSTMMLQELYATFNRIRNNGSSGNKDVVVQSVRNTVVSKATTHNVTFNYTPQLQRSMDLFRLTFAQKLHMEAIRTGLRLVCTAEDHSQLFYRVFNRVLDIPTRESYRAHLSRVLDENYNQSLQPPPESDLDKLLSGGESCVWLNASDVASHFRSIGMDVDSSLDIVNVEINPRSLPRILHNAQDLPTTRLVTPCEPDGFAESQHQQPRHNLSYPSSTAYQPFMDPAYNTRGYEKALMPIDISRLIHEIVQGTRCYSEHPKFNKNDLNVALAKAVARKH